MAATSPRNPDDAAMRILALMVAVDGNVHPRELDALEKLGAFDRLATTRERFLVLAQQCLAELGASLCEKSWLSASDESALDRDLDAVTDPRTRLLLCELAQAVAGDSPGRGVHLVCDHALARWHIARSDLPRPARQAGARS